MLNALCIRIFDEIKASSGKTAVQAEQDAKRIMGFDSPADVSTQRRRLIRALA
jgi:hypothetical protein